MKRIACLIPLFLLACATPGPRSERGPDGTLAYFIEVEASEPDVRIEANNEHIGNAPAKIKVFGDKDGTFHNFGSQEFVVKAFSKTPGKKPQVKVFRTGGWFSQEDRVPSKIYFDMDAPESAAPARY